MSTKKEYTLEELEAQYKEAEEKQKALKVQIEQKHREEERLKQIKLAEEKATRKKEVDEIIAKCREVLKAYMHDYGIYSYTPTSEDNDMFSSKFWNWIW